MINYILYVNNNDKVQYYKKNIQEFMINKKTDYKLYCYVNINNNDKLIKDNIDGKKIYIIDVEDNELEYAKKVRNFNDYCSQIIVLIDRDIGNDVDWIVAKKLFLLDVIYKDCNYRKKFNMYLNIDYNIINKNKALCFKYNNELFHILYDDIYYIEKNLNNNDSTIVTKDNKYIINLSINKLMKVLDMDYRFFKSHRSCIINVDNIVSYDISNNIIKFKNKEISLVSRSKKKELKDRLYDKYQYILK